MKVRARSAEWHDEMMRQVMHERERGFDCSRNKREIMRAFDRLPKAFRDLINALGPDAPDHVNDKWMSML